MTTHHHRDLLFISLAILVTICATLPSVVSARFFFPNTTSIPNHAPPGAWDSYRNFTGCSPGKTYDGLSNLKNYFHRFGYIPEAPPSNFTDDFDDALESAVRAYQKNFNLNITGELDNATLTQIVRPRCGVADIINGTTSMNSGKSNSSLHTVAHYSFFEGQPRWPEGTEELTYAFDPEESLDNMTKAVFASAFSRWSEVTTITFRETETYFMADIKIGFYSGDHGDGEAFDGVLGTLAHAFSPTNGRFHLDKAEDWVVSGDVTEASLSNAVDLESVAVHEIGHLLGLAHSSVQDAIMYPSISARTRKVVLDEDDIQGIQELYGSNPNFTGTPSTSSRERDSSDGGSQGGSVFFSVVLLGFALFLL
ncbi:metalloendoproteinase 2-MMP-like [Lotus japonicus]|uniref:metalloendoproteinase 2-MMP-like n=1 Tax=Lotus japonicus TaxID=34305 RepID=UPI002584AA72|nr:metalloendoproteinase 2-MMP-like [Lotus japonicus]